VAELNVWKPVFAIATASGSILAATPASPDAQDTPNGSLNIYTLPATTLVNSFPSAITGFYYHTPLMTPPMMLSASGTELAAAGGLLTATGCANAQVIATSAGPPLWCDATGQIQQMQLSPDGTQLAASTAPIGAGGYPYPNQPSNEGNTNLYNLPTLVSAVPGWAVGWIDDNHVLVNNYTAYNQDTGNDGYLGVTIYDASGNKVSAPTLPEIRMLQPVSATSVYSPQLNTIFSTTNGALLWTSGDSSLGAYGLGAVAGSEVVFVSGNLVLAQPF
jgi:hypothetical protein